MKRWPLLKRQPLPNSSDVSPGSANDAPPVATDLSVHVACQQAGRHDPLALFAKTHEHAMAYCDELASTLGADLRQAEISQLAVLWEMVPYHIGVVAAARFALTHATAHTPPPSTKIEPTLPEYHISSWFLARAHAYLTSNPDGYEILYLVTGMKISPMERTLDHLVKVPLSQQSATHAQADPHALQHILLEMDGYGHHAHALFHSHPGTGAGATRPSSTDLATQRLYEDGGYPLVSGICTRDGWFRFFAHRPFRITLQGKGVTQHEAHLFQIQNPARCVPYATVEAQDGGR